MLAADYARACANSFIISLFFLKFITIHLIVSDFFIIRQLYRVYNLHSVLQVGISFFFIQRKPQKLVLSSKSKNYVALIILINIQIMFGVWLDKFVNVCVFLCLRNVSCRFFVYGISRLSTPDQITTYHKVDVCTYSSYNIPTIINYKYCKVKLYFSSIILLSLNHYTVIVIYVPAKAEGIEVRNNF